MKRNIESLDKHKKIKMMSNKRQNHEQLNRLRKKIIISVPFLKIVYYEDNGIV